MADARTLIFHPAGGEKMSDFNKRLIAECTAVREGEDGEEDVLVTDIQACVIDGALVVTLLVGMVEATEEDVEDAGKDCDFEVGDEIPEGDALVAKCMVLRCQTPESAGTVADHFEKRLYPAANGLIVKQLVVSGRGLRVMDHPEDAERTDEDLKKAGQVRRKVYVETDVHYVVLVYLADALDEDDDSDIEDNLKRPRPVSAILGQADE